LNLESFIKRKRVSF